MLEQADNQREHPKTLHTERVVTQEGDKKFFVDLRENDRGRFVQITERFKGRHSSIIIPISAFGEVIDAMTTVETTEEALA